MTTYEKLTETQAVMTDFEDQVMRLVMERTTVTVAELPAIFQSARMKVLAKEYDKPAPEKPFELPKDSPFTQIVREHLLSNQQ